MASAISAEDYDDDDYDDYWDDDDHNENHAEHAGIDEDNEHAGIDEHDEYHSEDTGIDNSRPHDGSGHINERLGAEIRLNLGSDEEGGIRCWVCKGLNVHEKALEDTEDCTLETFRTKDLDSVIGVLPERKKETHRVACFTVSLHDQGWNDDRSFVWRGVMVY